MALSAHLCKCRESYLKENPSSSNVLGILRVHVILNGLLWPLRSSFCSFGLDYSTDTPQEGGPLLSPCPKLVGQRSCHSRTPQGYEVRVFLLCTDDQGCSTAELFELQCYSIYQHSFQFTPTGSGHTGTFSLTPTFYPLEKRGLPCQTGPSLTGNFLLGFPQSLQVGLCLGHVSLCVLSIIKPNSGENSRLFPRILSPNKHQ